MSYFRFPHISELSFTQGRRRRAFWPSPLNHTQRSESFIIVRIISISLTHKSCHKSTHISFCDNMRDQCWEVLQLRLLSAVWSQVSHGLSVLWITNRQSQCIKWSRFHIYLSYMFFVEEEKKHELIALLLWHIVVQNKGPPTLQFISVSCRGQSLGADGGEEGAWDVDCAKWGANPPSVSCSSVDGIHCCSLISGSISKLFIWLFNDCFTLVSVCVESFFPM